MIRENRRNYHYSLEDTLSRPLSRRRSNPSHTFLWMLILVLAGAGMYFLFSFAQSSSSIDSYLPIPSTLKFVRLIHNGQEVALRNGAHLTVNPKDTLMLMNAKTDGWITWGTRPASSDVDVELFRVSPVSLKSLWPDESFESPKTIGIEVFWWKKPLGNISITIELDAQDWLQKALAVPEPDQKIDYLKKVLEKNPGNVLIKTQMAALYFELHRYDDAVRLYKEIMETGKTKPLLDRLLGIYQRQNRVDDALNVYLDIFSLSRSSDELKQFLDYLEKHKSDADTDKFIRDHRNQIPASFQSTLDLFLANVYTRMKDWPKAAAAYERAVKSGIKDPDILYNLAATYQHGDNPDQAIQALDRYLKVNPQDLKTWMQLGSLQEKKGAPAQARTTYETVLQRNPKHEEALLRLVALLEKARDRQALQGAYEKLIQLQPKNKVAHFNLAMLYYEDQKWDKSVGLFQEVAAMDSRDLEPRKYILDIYRKTRNHAGEMTVLQELIRMEKNNLDYFKSAFSIYEEKKDYKSMAVLLKGGTEQHPESVQLHQYLLYALLKLDDKKAAVKTIEQIIQLQPQEKKHLRQAAGLYEELGQYAEAAKKLEKLVKLDPKDKAAKDDYMRMVMRVKEDKKSH